MPVDNKQAINGNNLEKWACVGISELCFHYQLCIADSDGKLNCRISEEKNTHKEELLTSNECSRTDKNTRGKRCIAIIDGLPRNQSTSNPNCGAGHTLSEWHIAERSYVNSCSDTRGH